MHKDGNSVARVRRELLGMGHTVSRDSISYWIHKYNIGLFGDLNDPKTPTVTTSVSQRDAELIRDCFSKDATLSSRDIYRMLKDDGASFNDTFDDVIFSDECSVQLHQNKVCSYRPKDSCA